MPVDFLTEEQQRRYGRYAREPSAPQLGRYFHLDDAERVLIHRRRGGHNRLGFAVQLGTVRFLGTFLANPAKVPPGVVAYLARQLGITETESLRRYATGEKRWDHSAEIRRNDGYRDFHQGSEAAVLTRWLSNRGKRPGWRPCCSPTSVPGNRPWSDSAAPRLASAWRAWSGPSNGSRRSAP